MPLGLTYAGIVESNKDPLKLGRVKVRVPHVFGSTVTGSGYIPVNDLPWALPAGMPAGGSSLSGGFSQLPEVGDKVWVRFLDGEPEKPIWEWGMQSLDDRDNLPLHRYGTGTPVGAPDRTIWTRYSHALEINAGSIIVTTSQGYRIVWTDASEVGAGDGNITLTTANGNIIKLDDSTETLTVLINEDVQYNIGSGVTGISDSYSWETMSLDYDLTVGRAYNLTTVDSVNITTAGDTSVDSLGNTRFTTTGDFTMGFTTLKLGLAAIQPAVLGTLLTTFLNTLVLYLDTHIHTSSTPGSPTSPPIVPSTATLTPQIAGLLSSTVTVQN